jgi:hypothetical protein
MVPQDAHVTGGDMTLYVRQVTALSTVRVHRITAPWLEATANWFNFNSAFDPFVEASFSNKWVGYTGNVNVDITPLVQEWVSGTFENDGLLLEQSGPGYTNYWSSENVPGLRPWLHLCYVIPG